MNCKKKYRCDDINRILKKYSKDSNSIDETMDRIEMFRNTKKSSAEETIA